MRPASASSQNIIAASEARISMRQQIRQLHMFLKRHSFYALAFGSALTLGLLAARIVRYDRLSLVFLVWNLMLAWVPYLASLWAVASQRRRPQGRHPQGQRTGA
jgi:hypothetical protein